MKKRHLLRGLCAATLAVASLGLAQAQSYPSKAVRLIVPFPAGGATDLFARTLSQKISEKLGQPLVVENRPGAGGTLGSDLAAKAQPDGYTLLLSTSSTHSIGPNLNPRMPYDAVRDFTPIVHLGNAPSIMLVPNNSPAKTAILLDTLGNTAKPLLCSASVTMVCLRAAPMTASPLPVALSA